MYNQLVLGQGCYGYINSIQYSNFRSYTDYKKSIENDKLPVEKAVSLNKDEVMRRKFIFGLKTRIKIDEFKKEFGISPINSSFKKTLNTMVKTGGITITKNEIKLTKIGSLFADWIQMAFYSNKYK